MAAAAQLHPTGAIATPRNIDKGCEVILQKGKHLYNLRKL